MIRAPFLAALCAAPFVLQLFSTANVASAAPAGPYACAVPRALLCEDCAQQIAIVLLPNGSCRISFTPHQPTTPEPASASPATETPLVFTVEPPPAPAVVRPSNGRWRLRWAAHPRQQAQIKAAHARCFVFNGNEYCE